LLFDWALARDSGVLKGRPPISLHVDLLEPFYLYIKDVTHKDFLPKSFAFHRSIHKFR